jgi:predicted RNase H-like nuclease (RuvC/YqgF family)
MNKNISLDIQKFSIENGNEEKVDDILNELSMDDIETISTENSAQNIKTLMMKTKSKQPTIDQYFQPFGGNDLEHENNLLKIEIKEIKDKLFLLEQYVICPTHPVSSSPSPNISYDRLSTQIREMENEMKKMKTTIEYLEGHQHELEERIDYFENILSTEENS